VSLRFKSRILDHLAHRNYLPILINEVARQLRVADEDEAEFLDTVRQLAESELIEIGKDEKLRLPRMPEEIEGVIKLTPRGMGFIKTDIDYREGDLFVPQGETKDATVGTAASAQRRRARATTSSAAWSRCCRAGDRGLRASSSSAGASGSSNPTAAPSAIRSSCATLVRRTPRKATRSSSTSCCGPRKARSQRA
jgi:hypothetical protein